MDTRKNRLVEVVITSTHNLCFEQEYEKHQNFYLKIFLFLVVKFSTDLNRRFFFRNAKTLLKKVPSDICAERRFRSAGIYAQSDQSSWSA